MANQETLSSDEREEESDMPDAAEEAMHQAEIRDRKQMVRWLKSLNKMMDEAEYNIKAVNGALEIMKVHEEEQLAELTK